MSTKSHAVLTVLGAPTQPHAHRSGINMQGVCNISKAVQQPRIVAPDWGISLRLKLTLDDGIGVQVPLPNSICLQPMKKVLVGVFHAKPG